MFLFTAYSAVSQIYPRTDTLFINHVSNYPVVNGIGDEDAWKDAPWNNISYIWMPYDNQSSYVKDGLKLVSGSGDFSGRFKVVWNSDENLLYFLAETTDDAFVDGYVYNQSGTLGGYPDYDILEVFIDENRSGGRHVFDSPNSNTAQYGTNAENAFSYHIAVNEPEENASTESKIVLDIAGTTWGNVPNYESHLPEFALRKSEGVYTWEFSLRVYGENYNHSNPAASEVVLSKNKVMGLSMAYCDNDDLTESPKKRDHFFGSVYVPGANHNDHWMNADWFGVAKLTDKPDNTGIGRAGMRNTQFDVLNINGELLVNMNVNQAGPVQIRIFNLLGSEIQKYSIDKPAGPFQTVVPVSQLKPAVYLIDISQGKNRYTKKVIL